MKIAARRRLAVGALATSGALVAGLVIAPLASARDNGLSVSPSALVNNAAQDITLTSTDADQRYGALATFTLINSPATFTVEIGQQLPIAKDTTGTAEVDFTDLGDGIGADGPADAGTYRVGIVGNPNPLQIPGTGGGGTDNCASCFTVLRQAPVTVTSVAPTSLRPGNASNISILGTGFTRNSRIEFLNGTTVDTGITFGLPLDADGAAEDDGITTNTELRRRLVIAGTGVPAGPRNVRVTNPNGDTFTLNNAFTVAGAALTSVNPSGGNNAPTTSNVSITVSGSDVADGELTLEFLGTPGSSTRQALTIPTTKTSRTATSLTGTANLSDAAPGVYQPVVRGPNGVVNACDSQTATGCRFTVVQDRTPTVTGVDRAAANTGSSQQAGTTDTFDITGTNFSRGAAVTVSGEGVTTTAVEFISNTLLRATFSSTAAAAAGARNVTVTLTDGKTASCTGCYTVTAAQQTQTPTPTSTQTQTPTPTSTATGTAGISSRYVGLSTPVRVRDTRGPNLDQPRVTREVVVDLSGQISDAGATAAVLNVTVTTPSARGFVVAYPNGTTKPGTSNVNFERGQTQANEVTVRLPASRRVSLFVDSAQAHVIADLVGYFTTTQGQGGQVVTQTPTRVFDSRDTSTPRRTGEVVVDLPQVATGTVDVILNVTVTGSRVTDPRRGRGFVVAYATGTQRPQTSNVNFDAGQQQANEVITRVGTGQNAKKVSLFIDSTVVGLIVDLVGYVHPQPQPGSQVFTALTTPQRALDTRNGTGTDRTGRRTGDVVLTLPSSIPSGATGVVLNVTATNGTNRGFVTVYPTGQARPNTSNVNFPVNLTQANEAVTGVNNQRQVTLFVGGAGSPSANLVVDVVGYFTAGPQPSASPSASNCIPVLGICG